MWVVDEVYRFNFHDRELQSKMQKRHNLMPRSPSGQGSTGKNDRGLIALARQPVAPYPT